MYILCGVWDRPHRSHTPTCPSDVRFGVYADLSADVYAFLRAAYRLHAAVIFKAILAPLYKKSKVCCSIAKFSDCRKKQSPCSLAKAGRRASVCSRCFVWGTVTPCCRAATVALLFCRPRSEKPETRLCVKLPF